MRRSQEEEFAVFFDTASPRLVTAAWMLTGDLATAEDLAQEALVRTYARWGRVRDGQPMAYARRVLTNLHADRWRRHGREFVSDSLPERGIGDPQLAAHTDLVRALRALAPRERECVVLRHYLDLSEKDTAATLGIAVGSVKAYTRDGLTRLRTALAEEETHV